MKKNKKDQARKLKLHRETLLALEIDKYVNLAVGGSVAPPCGISPIHCPPQYSGEEGC